MIFFSKSYKFIREFQVKKLVLIETACESDLRIVCNNTELDGKQCDMVFINMGLCRSWENKNEKKYHMGNLIFFPQFYGNLIFFPQFYKCFN